ncbi:MAG: hypothetical protein AAF403_08760, partial [Pseudomonadota bacterium]
LNLYIVNRNQKNRDLMCDDLSKICQPNQTLYSLSWDEITQYTKNLDLLVNATSLGMKNAPEIDDLSGYFKHLKKETIIYDLVYNPIETKLILFAKAHSLKTIDGLGMLVYQALPAFKKWFKPKGNPSFDPYLKQCLLAKL